MVSDLNKDLREIEAWLNRSVEGEQPYVQYRAPSAVDRRGAQALGAGCDGRDESGYPEIPGICKG
jgi:hypothetical protein